MVLFEDLDFADDNNLIHNQIDQAPLDQGAPNCSGAHPSIWVLELGINSIARKGNRLQLYKDVPYESQCELEGANLKQGPQP